MHRGPRQGLIAAGKTFAQQRKYSRRRKLRACRTSAVAVVLDPFDAPATRIAAQSPPAKPPAAGAGFAAPCLAAKGRARRAWRPPRSDRAAQQVEQQGLGLVVALMRQRQPFRIDFRKAA
jgi:hypothetical protein